jgi:hypothetical protein
VSLVSLVSLVLGFVSLVSLVLGFVSLVSLVLGFVSLVSLVLGFVSLDLHDVATPLPPHFLSHTRYHNTKCNLASQTH